MGIPAYIAFLASPPTLYNGDVTANWQSGVATSGLAGADYLLIGNPGTMYYAAGLLGMPIILVSIGDLTPGATITWRAYIAVFGVMRYVGDDDYVVGVDPDVMLIYAWTNRGQIRIELVSDNIGDNGAAIPYEYVIKTYGN